MVGPNSNRSGVQYTGLMNQEHLDTFYREKIDIYINPEPGLHFNGWPLGTEAMIQGAVMITTDPLGMNNHYHFTKDEMVIVPVGGAEEIATAVVELVNDRALLHRVSNMGQKRLFEVLNYDNGIGKVFEAMEARMEKERQRLASL